MERQEKVQESARKTRLGVKCRRGAIHANDPFGEGHCIRHGSRKGRSSHSLSPSSAEGGPAAILLPSNYQAILPIRPALNSFLNHLLSMRLAAVPACRTSRDWPCANNCAPPEGSFFRIRALFRHLNKRSILIFYGYTAGRDRQAIPCSKR